MRKRLSKPHLIYMSICRDNISLDQIKRQTLFWMQQSDKRTKEWFRFIKFDVQSLIRDVQSKYVTLSGCLRSSISLCSIQYSNSRIEYKMLRWTIIYCLKFRYYINKTINTLDTTLPFRLREARATIFDYASFTNYFIIYKAMIQCIFEDVKC